MPLISLIIPVFNTEKYLNRCLDSCLSQTFKDIEIICVNDNSPDNCKNILNDYSLKDNRIKIINHNINKGPGAARNTGVKNSTGKYIWFIDSDDYIILNACEILNDLIKQSQADIIRFKCIDYYIKNNENIIIMENNKYFPNGLTSIKNLPNLLYNDVCPSNYITAFELIKNIKFREGFFYEDIDFTTILFSKARSIFSFDASLYCYCHRLGSTTNGETNTYNEKSTIGTIFATEAINNYVKNEKFKKKHFCYRYLNILYNIIINEYKKFPDIHTNELNIILKNIKKNRILFKHEDYLYIDIITKYGNTWILSFFLKIYRYLIKRLYFILNIFSKKTENS